MSLPKGRTPSSSSDEAEAPPPGWYTAIAQGDETMSVARASLVSISQWHSPEDQRIARELPEGQVSHALAQILF